MDPSNITPFIDAVQNVFETMLQLHVQADEPFVKQNDHPNFDVSGIIGMSGDIVGCVVLSFPMATAERVISLFTGTDMERTHEEFADAVGELVNMISGGAKAKLAGKNVSISCPSVVMGGDHSVFGGRNVTTVVIPCSSDCGDFSVEVCIRASTASIAA